MSIQTAARTGNLTEVERQLALGVNVNSRHYFTRDTPLIEAAYSGHVEIVKILIDHGADVNLKGEAWCGPLHAAALGGHVEVVKLLLHHGADVNIFSHNKPLHYAAMNGHIEVAQILIAHGADINAKGTDEYTPLGTAVSNLQVDMVEYLLSKGADVNARAIYGCSPLHTAVSKRNIELARLLSEHGANTNFKCNGRTALIDSVLNDDAEMTEMLLSFGANVNAKDDYENTPLYISCQRNNVEIGGILLANGADPTIECGGRRIPESFIERLR
jgi:ankyrin repeat protein